MTTNVSLRESGKRNEENRFFTPQPDVIIVSTVWRVENVLKTTEKTFRLLLKEKENTKRRYWHFSSYIVCSFRMSRRGEEFMVCNILCLCAVPVWNESNKMENWENVVNISPSLSTLPSCWCGNVGGDCVSGKFERRWGKFRTFPFLSADEFWVFRNSAGFSLSSSVKIFIVFL